MKYKSRRHYKQNKMEEDVVALERILNEMPNT